MSTTIIVPPRPRRRREPERRHLAARRPTRAARLAELQGIFYAATGVWPILHMRSFEAVSGRKTDRWLVRTVGGLLGVTGAALWSAGYRRRLTPEMLGVAVGSAAVLTAIDVIYASRGRISRVYLLDALAELGLLGLWGLATRGGDADADDDDAP